MTILPRLKLIIVMDSKTRRTYVGCCYALTKRILAKICIACTIFRTDYVDLCLGFETGSVAWFYFYFKIVAKAKETRSDQKIGTIIDHKTQILNSFYLWVY